MGENIRFQNSMYALCFLVCAFVCIEAITQSIVQGPAASAQPRNLLDANTDLRATESESLGVGPAICAFMFTKCHTSFEVDIKIHPIVQMGKLRPREAK